MAKKTGYSNENYTHSCDEQLVDLNLCHERLWTSCYEDSDIKRIVDFYITRAPILNSGTRSSFYLQSLGDYGWRGNADLHALETRLLVAAGMNSFVMLKSNSITETLANMELGELVCPTHPRAVLQLSCKAKVHEDGSLFFDSLEPRLQCLFRHLRNAICHGCIYVMPDSRHLLLKDFQSEGDWNPTASILIEKTTLIKWIEVTESK